MWDVIDLSRWQFALTALYHFLFVPLTLGLIFLLAIMETIYVVTGKTIYRDMTRFWGKLFGINFALGVATGLTMEFQFGTNWSFYSNYVGDIFGAPLAMEALMAFFLESMFASNGERFPPWGVPTIESSYSSSIMIPLTRYFLTIEITSPSLIVQIGRASCRERV